MAWRSILLWNESIFFSVVAVILQSSEFYKKTEPENALNVLIFIFGFVYVFHFLHAVNCQTFPPCDIFICAEF